MNTIFFVVKSTSWEFCAHVTARIVSATDGDSDPSTATLKAGTKASPPASERLRTRVTDKICTVFPVYRASSGLNCSFGTAESLADPGAPRTNSSTFQLQEM